MVVLLDLLESIDRVRTMTAKLVGDFPKNRRPMHEVSDNKCDCPVFAQSFQVGEGAISNGYVNCIFCACDVPVKTKAAPEAGTPEAKSENITT